MNNFSPNISSQAPGINPNQFPPNAFPMGTSPPYIPGINPYNPNISNPHFPPIYGQLPPNLNYSLGSNQLNHSMSAPNGVMGSPINQFNPAMPGTLNNTYGIPHPSYAQYLFQNTQNLANMMSNIDAEALMKNQYNQEIANEKEELKKQTEMIKKGLEDKNNDAESREDRNRRRLEQFRKGAYFKPPIETFVPKSEYFYERDRYFLEQILMKPIKTNGIIGTQLVEDFDKTPLLGEKIQFYLQDVKFLQDKDEYFEKAIKDGIYLDYIKQLIYSYNIQKIEQRAAREGKKDWFTHNGELRMDNDIFSDVITKPLDISLSQNDIFRTFYSNTTFSGRNSGEKLRVFKLRIIISKIVFNYLPIFNEEERLASDVKRLHREYYTYMNKLNIPYLIEKIQIIRAKIASYSNQKEQTEAMKIEMKNMKIFLNESTDFLASEKNNLNAKANELYNKWLELKNKRKIQQFQSTRVKLNVIRFSCNEMNPNIYDYAFILTNTDITADTSKLPSSENSHREKVKSIQCVLKVYINGVFAFETKPSNITWPLFEAEINSLYVLNLYTRPTRMEIELYINKELVERFDAEPPGIFAKTVTSSATLSEEVDFGIDKSKKKNQKLPDNEELKEEDKQDEENEKLLPSKEEENYNSSEYYNNRTRGKIIMKTEWEGQAPDLPPTKIENKLELVNRQLEFKEEIRIYNKFDYPFDVNDPRNVAFVEEMKRGRLEIMLKYLYKEYLLNYYDVRSKRHYLLLKRLEKSSLSDTSFPILEAQIESNKNVTKLLQDLMREDEVKYINKEDESEAKILEGIEKLRKEYSGKILSEEEFMELQKKKIHVMKKDIVHQLQYSYNQIISEAEIYDDPIFLLKEFIIRVFSRSRKLAPRRIKPPPVKVEKTKEMKIHIHVVKGYNVPVRVNVLPTNVLDEMKLESVGIKVGSINKIFSQNPNVFTGSNPNLSHGSNAFNPQPGSLHQSFNIEMMNQMNQSGTIGRNPNLVNAMYNPFNPGVPSTYVNMGQFNNMDTISKVNLLNSLEKKVNSFIEVKIVYYDQEGTFRTDAVDSIHPDYNHQLEFTIKPRNNGEYFDKEQLSKCPGGFYFTLYDEVRNEGLTKGKAVNTFIQRFEKKYLGSFMIPFATVFQNASILDTICKVNIPQTVFGYYSDTSSTFDVVNQLKKENEEELQRLRQQQQKVSGALQNMEPSFGYHKSQENIKEIPKIINPFINTYVSLYITLDPEPQFTKNEDLDYVPGFEDSIFLINATKWGKMMKEKSLLKKRNIRIFAENFDGFSVFIPRFLRPEGQRPHHLIFNKNDPNAIEKVARYVALIPFIEDSQTWDYAEEMPDCWCTDREFLTLGFGDYEEHAVLLCNYFNYVDQQQGTGCVSYLCLGDAHPEGLTIYVMRISKSCKEVEFWNAKTGECFFFDKTIEETNFLCLTVSKGFKYTKSNSDQICQLKSVGAIATFDNIYVNIQKYDDPGLMDFDLTNRSNWTPFLNDEAKNKYFPNGVTTIQKDIEYTDPNEQDANQLQKAIKEFLKKEIEKVRAQIEVDQQPLRTTWELRANDKIEKILQQYEMFCFNSTKSVISKMFSMGTLQTGDIKQVSSNAQQSAKDLLDEQRKDQDNFMSQLIDFEKQIKDEFVAAKEIYGFPINLSYTTMKEVWTHVKLTDVHLIGTETSELSLTVYVNPLPANVNSVWIFFAILKKE